MMLYASREIGGQMPCGKNCREAKGTKCRCKTCLGLSHGGTSQQPKLPFEKEGDDQRLDEIAEMMKRSGVMT